MVVKSETVALLETCSNIGRTTAASIQLARDWRQLCPLSDVSCPVTVCGDLETPTDVSATAETVPRFRAFSKMFKRQAPDAAFVQSMAVVGEMESMAFTGGKPTVMAWCPTCISDAPEMAATHCNTAKRTKTVNVRKQWRYLAVAVQSDVCRDRSGAETPLVGCGMIQIWRLLHTLDSTKISDDSGPSFIMGLLHDGALAHAMSWCPAAEHLAPWCAENSGSTAPTLAGLLAAAHGDGKIAVYAVPRSHVPECETEAEVHSNGSSVVRMDPIMSFDLWAEAGCLPSSLDWLPAEPHDLLVAGTWDGHLVLLQVCHSGRLELLKKIKVLPQAVRAAKFPPPSLVTASESKPERNVVVIGGQDGSIRLWDLRDPYEPFEDIRRMRQQVVTDLSWVEGLNLIATHDDGSLLAIGAKPEKPEGTRTDKYMHSAMLQFDAPLLSCDVTPGRLGFEFTVCAGEGGVLAIQQTNTRERRREPGVVAFLASKIDGGIRFRPPLRFGDMKLPLGPEPRGCKETLEAKVPDEQLSVLCARWVCAGEAGNVYRVASTHASGMLRIQTFHLPHVPSAE